MIINRNSICWVAAAVFFLTSCGPSQKAEESTDSVPTDLVGTWKLKQRIDHANQKTEWEDVTDSIIYDKYLTDSHFTWINYDKNNEVLLGIGGGTYTFDGTTYTENIEFFRPPSSGILGQQIVFSAEFKEGKWYHTGYTKDTEFDPELAKTVVVDSTRIEEVWEKVPGVAEGAELVQGTWSLLSYKDDVGGVDLNYPDFINYVKLITPTHFIWIQYNDEGDEVSGTGSGSYKYADGMYVETIQMMYPAGSGLEGGDYSFRCQIDGNRWSHASESFVAKDGSTIDSLFIDEQWARMGTDL